MKKLGKRTLALTLALIMALSLSSISVLAGGAETVKVGETKKLTANTDRTDVTWSSSDSAVASVESDGTVMYVNATAYSADDPGNSAYTALGTHVRHGIIAVDPSIIPLGTHVYIPGYGEAVAEDVGGAIRGHRIDVAFDSRAEALAFGRQDIEIYIRD